MSLRLKTIIGVAIIEAMMLSLLVWSSLEILKTSNESELIKRAKATANLFVSSIKNAVISNDLATIESSVQEIYKNKEIIYVKVFGQNNMLYSKRSRLKKLKTFKEDLSYQEAVLDGIFDTSLSIKEGTGHFGRVEIGFSIQHIKKIIQEARQKSLFIASLELALSALFSFFLGVYLTKAISNLSQGASKIADGELGYQIKYSGKDELAIAVEAFNNMSHRLEILEAKYKQHSDDLEKMVAQRTAQLKATQEKLVEKAHKAGMADIAADIMHNVGNTLNSLKVSSDLAYQSIKDSKGISGLQKANQMLDEKSDNLKNFFINDPKGKHLLSYFRILENSFSYDFKTILEHLKRVKDTTDEIAKIVSTQHQLVGQELHLEKVHLAELIEKTLNHHSQELKEKNISITRSYGQLPSLSIHKKKFLYVLSSLIQNACEAMESNPEKDRKLDINTKTDQASAYMNVSDNGVGIKKDLLTKVFTKDYTTKANADGFTLHNCANYISEMGGKIWAESQGNHKGTSIFIKLPLSDKD